MAGSKANQTGMEPLASLYAQMKYEALLDRAKASALAVLGGDFNQIQKIALQQAVKRSYCLGRMNLTSGPCFNRARNTLTTSPTRWTAGLSGLLAHWQTISGQIRYFPLVNHLLRPFSAGHYAQTEYLNHRCGFWYMIKMDFSSHFVGPWHVRYISICPLHLPHLAKAVTPLVKRPAPLIPL